MKTRRMRGIDGWSSRAVLKAELVHVLLDLPHHPLLFFIHCALILFVADGPRGDDAPALRLESSGIIAAFEGPHPESFLSHAVPSSNLRWEVIRRRSRETSSDVGHPAIPFGEGVRAQVHRIDLVRVFGKQHQCASPQIVPPLRRRDHPKLDSCFGHGSLAGQLHSGGGGKDRLSTTSVA